MAATATNDGTYVTIASATSGPPSAVSITGVNGDWDGGGNIDHTYGIDNGSGIPGSAAASTSLISISNGTNTANLGLTFANAKNVAQARSYIQSQLTALGVTGVTVGGTGNRIDLAGAADGSNTVTVSGAGAANVFGAGHVDVPASPARASCRNRSTRWSRKSTSIPA